MLINIVAHTFKIGIIIVEACKNLANGPEYSALSGFIRVAGARPVCIGVQIIGKAAAVTVI